MPATMSGRWQQACAAPALAVFSAFWLLPMVRLITLPAEKAWDLYFVVLTEPAYLISLVNYFLLSVSVTALTLMLGGAVGIFLGRHRFAGRRMLLAALTMPLSFPGVIIGFFVILLGGRQGMIPSLTDELGLGRWTFAYGLFGLFIAYIYFSLPRAISAYTAAAQAMDPSLEESARTLGARPWHIVRDVWIPELAPTTLACGAIIFATAMGAFGTAFTLASKFEVLPITIYSEFTNYANFGVAASLSISLGLVTWAALALAGRRAGTQTLGL